MNALLALWIATATGRASEPCVLDAPPDAPFSVAAPDTAGQVLILVELWVGEPSQVPWAEEVLSVLEARGLPGVVAPRLRRAGDPGCDDSELCGAAPELVALAERAASRGHTVAVRLGGSEVPRDAQAGVRPLRQRIKSLRKVSDARAVVAPLPTKTTEALLGRAGFKSLLIADGPASATPRRGAVFEGQPTHNVVLVPGPYAGACGSRPLVGAFTPRAADRVTQALHGAARTPGAPTLRIILGGTYSSPNDARVLARWLDEVLLPAGGRPTTPEGARVAALRAIRSGPDPSEQASRPGGGRLVALDELRTAAGFLEGKQILPRTLPGDLNLTEAFYGFALLLAERTEADVVRLGALSGPATEAESSLEDAPFAVEADQVARTASALLAELPEEIPAAVPVGGKLLTAGEVLLLMASAIRGESPAVTLRSASPEPNVRGLGWGASTLP